MANGGSQTRFTKKEMFYADPSAVRQATFLGEFYE
jgi:hypothetical protein